MNRCNLNQNFATSSIIFCVCMCWACCLVSMTLAIKTICLLMRITTNMNVIFLWFISAYILFCESVWKWAAQERETKWTETKRNMQKHHLRIFKAIHISFDMFSSQKICLNWSNFIFNAIFVLGVVFYCFNKNKINRKKSKWTFTPMQTHFVNHK